MSKTKGNLTQSLEARIKAIRAIKDVKRLKAMLLERLTLHVENVAELAAIIVTLEEQGEDLSEYQIALLPDLRRIGYGQVLPELFVMLHRELENWSTAQKLLRRASRLPIPDQKRIAEGKPIKVMEASGDHRLIQPLKLTTDEIDQVFASDHIRDDAEQAAYLREKEGRRLPSPRPHGGSILVHKRERTVEITEPMTLTQKQVLEILAEMG